jgi:hypothetical protein
MSCESKKQHLYIRYYCKLCEDFHYKDSILGIWHLEYKLNRYWCPKCRRTHISSRGDIFLEHLEEGVKEISFFGFCCAFKCSYKKHKDITLTDEDALAMLNLQNKLYYLTNKKNAKNFLMNDRLLKTEINRIEDKIKIKDMEYKIKYKGVT